MVQVVNKTWADGRLRFLQIRRGGRVVFGLIYDADDAVMMRLVSDMVPLIARAFGLSDGELYAAIRRL